jgi:RimJ/RimL family protein N-acetyltransferase
LAEPWPAIEPLQTPRLQLEPLRVEDAAEMAVVLSGPELYTHTGGAPPSEAELVERYERQVRGVSADGSQGWLNWVLRLRGDGLAGYVQATVAPTGPELGADLAWVVGRRQGEGLASEAASAVAAWLTANGVDMLTAHIAPANAPSCAVARRLGMVPTGEVRDGEDRWIVEAPGSGR